MNTSTSKTSTEKYNKIIFPSALDTLYEIIYACLIIAIFQVFSFTIPSAFFIFDEYPNISHYHGTVNLLFQEEEIANSMLILP